MPTTSPHILRTFDEALAALRGDVLMMASLTQRNLERALTGLFERDDDLCNVVIVDDEEVDTLEKQVDARGIDILSRFQPVASDLRNVVTAMKLSTSLERVADQAVNIARKAKKLNRLANMPEGALLKPLAERAMALFTKSISAYDSRDIDLAGTIKPEDRELDAEHHRVAELLMERMEIGGKQTAALLNLVLIARHLERVGDHATNIAEDVVFAEAAEDIRHAGAGGR
ncbi:MAG: phosphate signaling complex protein PhoU [Verrucomicrobiota bacterium]|nr:phosphate signaling complex protein PhoU [Verrucomicrobiota bacterium]